MNNVVQLGPVVLAADRLLAVLLLLAFMFGLDWIARRNGKDASRDSTLAILIGVIAARAAYVLRHLEAYAQDWLTAAAVWQGGFDAWAGIASAALVLLWRMGVARPGQHALTLVGILSIAWFGGAALLRPAPAALPDLPPLTRISGDVLDPAELAGRPFVVNLWATWCPPCRRELPMLAAAAKDATVPILLVNQGEDAAQVARYLTTNQVASDAVALDSQAILTSRLGSAALPTTLFINGNGQVVATHVGEISRAALSDEIRKLEGN